ncbi:hypothetical protein [Pantoea dispersa]|uniref:hypothetical protein n=1 Tax=Pantoea dispersa TaxID=59814 RepID=UPI001CA6A69B|nr:hypothetical protein [Pantoea dispersa]QZY95701.1 hypothetical protein K7X52_04360 [Pantoea dispersa]
MVNLDKILKSQSAFFLFLALLLFMSLATLLAVISLFIYLYLSPTLPVQIIFLIPIAGGFIYYFLYRSKKFKAVIVWTIDVSLAMSALVISLFAITKAYSQTWYNSITTSEGATAAAVLTYLAICTVCKALIIFFSKKDYEEKYPQSSQTVQPTQSTQVAQQSESEKPTG